MDPVQSNVGSKIDETGSANIMDCSKTSDAPAIGDAKQANSSEPSKANNSKKPLTSPIAKPKTGVTANNTSSKIPSMKKQPNVTTAALKNKTDPSSPSAKAGATQKTISRLSLTKPSSIAKQTKTEASVSKTSLPAKAVSTSNSKALPKNPQLTKLTRPGILRRTDSNLSRRSASTASGKLRPITSTAGDQNKMELLEKKLRDAQTEFLKNYETLKVDTLPNEKLEKEFKFISCRTNDECKLMIKDDQLKRMPHTLPPTSVADFKDKITLSLAEHLTKIMENYKDFSENGDEREKHLQEMKDTSAKNVGELVDDLCNSLSKDPSDDLEQIVNLKKELEDTQISLKLAETKLVDANKEHEDKLSKLECDVQAKATEELSRKDGQIKDLQKKLKSLEKQNDELKKDLKEKTDLEEELKACKENCNALQKKLSTTEQLLGSERKSKNEITKKFESEISTLNGRIEEMKTKQKMENKTPEHLRQITELRNKINDLEYEKQEKITDLESEKQALENKLQDLVAESSTNNNELCQKLRDAENQVQSLKQQLSESEKLSETKSDSSKDVQLELAKLRQSETEKRREIEKLKVELSKSIYNINQLNCQIQRDQQLLEVRSELINSLQTNDKNQRIQLEELFARVGEKNTTVNELNSELRCKSEEYTDLYSSINAKQLELSNQAHMIKLLEESNERNQMLRVKQEEKISRMEEDIAHLKQTIAIYQANIISGNPKLVCQPVMPRLHDDYNENFYYYTSERKRKRQIDINVRKYEA